MKRNEKKIFIWYARNFSPVQFRDVANCHFPFYVERLFSKNDRQFPFSRNKMAVLWICKKKKKTMGLSHEDTHSVYEDASAWELDNEIKVEF